MKRFNIGMNQLYGNMIETLRRDKADVVFMIDNRVQTMCKNISVVTRHYNIGVKYNVEDEFGIYSYFILPNNTKLVLIPTYNTILTYDRVESAIDHIKNYIQLEDKKVFITSKEEDLVTKLENNIQPIIGKCDLNIVYVNNKYNTGGLVEWLQQSEELVI